ncbi:MAG: hypothetical protein HFH86_00650 [Bacilli bacterium]|jgi:hypothetical protein|nr:hypothetical protein [Bacilli bacterium]
MKNKYQRLTKEEKKECQKMYYSTPKGKEMHLRLIRLSWLGILGILFSVFLFGQIFLKNEHTIWNYFSAISLLIFSFIFLGGSYFIRIKVLNQFAIKIPRFKNR